MNPIMSSMHACVYMYMYVHVCIMYDMYMYMCVCTCYGAMYGEGGGGQ